MSNRRPTFGAFNQGEVPTIACFNQAVLNREAICEIPKRQIFQGQAMPFRARLLAA